MHSYKVPRTNAQGAPAGVPIPSVTRGKSRPLQEGADSPIGSGGFGSSTRALPFSMPRGP